MKATKRYGRGTENIRFPDAGRHAHSGARPIRRGVEHAREMVSESSLARMLQHGTPALTAGFPMIRKTSKR